MTRTAQRFPLLIAAIATLAPVVAVLAVVLHFAAKPVSAQTMPEVTIAADRQTIIAELDDLVLTLTRTVATEELDVNVVLTQNRDFLEESALLPTVTFGAGQGTAELRMLAWDHFAGHEVTQNGTITATVRDGTGYVAGTPATATVGVVVADPAVTVWHEQDRVQVRRERRARRHRCRDRRQDGGRCAGARCEHPYSLHHQGNRPTRPGNQQCGLRWPVRGGRNRPFGLRTGRLGVHGPQGSAVDGK